MHMRRNLKLHLFLALALFSIVAAPRTLHAQIDTATVAGRVTDKTGATVPNADITVTSTETNFAYHAKSASNGEWTISPVHIGTYKLTVKAEGFNESVAGPFTLSVQQRQQIDLALQTGGVTAVVDVTDTAPVLETATSERSQLIDSRTMTTLPLNGRNPVQLAQLSAGVTVSEPGARDEQGYGFSANGARSLQNNFLLDGIDNNSNLPDLLNEANYAVMPSVDALQEFRFETDAYSAEFGRATGAVINATTKSGTNHIHGVVYEFLRNQAFDARNYFDQTLPAYHQNQFGATIGLPIRKDKLFFFADYEGLRLSQGQTNTAIVPTAAQRGGDFTSQLDLTSPTGALDCNGRATYAGELFDTRNTQVAGGGTSAPSVRPHDTPAVAYCGVPFGYNADGTPSNIIPTASIDTLGAKLAALYPAPNANGNGYNYVSNPKLIRNYNQGDVRVDQVLTHSDNIFYRFSIARQPSTIPAVFPGLADGGGFFSGVGQNNAYSIAISETHVFTPTRVNEIRLGYNRLHTSRFQFNSNTDVSGQIGFPGVPYQAGTNNGGLPQMFFNDVATLGSPTYLPSNEIQNVYSISDTFTLIHGNHSLKFGGEYRPEEFTIFQPAAPRGDISFGPQFTDNPAAQGTGGSGFATLLTGQPDGGGINNINNVDYNRKVYGVFLQDDWRATPTLTINAGIRYDFFSAILERHNAQANFNPATGQLDIPKSSNVTLTPTFASEITVNHTASNGLIPPVYTNVSPRLGLAWQFRKGWVARAAAGLFFNGEESGPYSNPSPGFNPPYFASQNYVAPCSLPSYAADSTCEVPGLSVLSNGFPTDALVDPNTPNLMGEDKLKTPYVAQWHLTVQHELTPHTTVEVAFVGSKGSHLYTFGNLNQAAPTADSSAPSAPRRPFSSLDTYIGWLRSNGFSNYNSAQFKLEQHLSHGVAAIVNYTYSHALGNSSNANLGSQNNDSFRDELLVPEYGNLDFDNRHRFTTGYSWDLPIGKGKALAGDTGTALNYLVGDWQLSGIATVSSGTWYTVTDGNSNFANSDGQQRPDFTPGQKSSGKPCVAGTSFNTCAFQDPAPGSFGNVGLNTVNGPGDKNWDISILKTIALTEARRFELRGEFYNALNHPNFLFAAPGPQNSNNATTFGSTNFGIVTAARDPRLIQIGLKFYY
ncbi:outer membrane receptor protein involved in Fe transport [Granulicella aggregans]|uniref:Outer membrane receptor protein involved in Fe transport n=1 Tax=Granulicella aggregans TaxID=474949 RepID=A0A7W8E2E1_9BACT|nr:TonB-dependent receptor [Granulicella aggregans]MBB5056417.1 outer membrane receptor protein involved in Fe transport [Granulicella aggregans]